MSPRFKTDREVKERVSALVREAASQNRPHDRSLPPTFKKYLLTGAAIFGAAILTAYLLTQSAAPAYSGRITHPLAGSKTSCVITVSGPTENMPPELPYAIVAVDVPDLRLTWPKRPFIQPNTNFRVSFYEGGPGPTCRISLYAVTHDMHDKINAWFQQERLSGMPLFQDRYRLESTTVIISNSI